jgi:hypothetical protein
MDAPEAFGIVYDPIETLAYVAAQTSRITLGTSVLDALFQSPIILAPGSQRSTGSATVGSSSGSATAGWSRNSRPRSSILQLRTCGVGSMHRTVAAEG